MIRSAEPREPEAASLSPSARTAISLLLFVHLFAIGLALVANTAEPTPSRLLAVIRTRLLGPYLQLTWTDVGYHYHFMGANDLDFPHRLRAQLVSPGQEQGETIALEPEGIGGLRQRRYQRLAYWVGRGGDALTLLPSEIGGGLIKQSGDPSLQAILECYSDPPANLGELPPTDGPAGPQRVYRARISLVNGRGSVVDKFEERGTIAPASGAAVGAPPSGSSTRSFLDSQLRQGWRQ